MRILITGAGGFLGRRVVARLAELRDDVIAVDLVPAQVKAPGVTYVTGDLSDPTQLVPDHSRENGFCLIHLAWDLKRDPVQFRVQAAHVTLLAGLLDAWCGNGLRRVIVMGSAEEYGRCAGRIAETDEPVGPLSPYGWAKRAARELASLKCAAAGVNLLWLRPFIMYGPGQGGDMAIPFAVRKAAARERADFTDGLQERDFVYVDDVVDAIVAGCEKNPSGDHAVNLGTGNPVPLRDVLGQIAIEMNATSQFKFGAKPRRPGEPETQVADTDRAKSILGWEAKTAWRDGIRNTCAAAASR